MKGLDRGNKLWEGHRMILPEHEERLWKERRKAEAYVPPDLDPDQLAEIGRMIERALLEEEPILITYASKYGPKKVCGFVARIDSVERWILIKNGDHREMIPFRNILGAESPPEDA
ncbi:YolD-like family protein [Salinithrix halophila]|uniref:YolD-like family protein n=1 Tax=Salinithrix halophila TaxID=1485204 RepID=A0ABV8JKV5_9BACL